MTLQPRTAPSALTAGGAQCCWRTVAPSDLVATLDNDAPLLVSPEPRLPPSTSASTLGEVRHEF